MAVFCGIDWSDDHHDVALVDQAGTTLAQLRIGHVAGFAELLCLLADHGDQAGEQIPVAIETGRGLLVAALRSTGRSVFAINPLSVSRYRDRHSVAGRKSDPGDALVLAHLLRTDMAAHRALPEDSDQVRLIRTQLIAILRRAGRIRLLAEQAEALQIVLRRNELRQPDPVERAMGQQALALLRPLDAACRNVDELAVDAEAAFAAHPDAAIIASFPGIGDLTGARILAEIGYDRSRFADARGLKAYPCAAPITRASGKSRCVATRRIKNQRLAAAGYSWAFSSLTASAGARTHYDRRRLRGDAHVAAQRNLFNRLLGCLHHCLITGATYHETIAFPTTEQAAA